MKSLIINLDNLKKQKGELVISDETKDVSISDSRLGLIYQNILEIKKYEINSDGGSMLRN